MRTINLEPNYENTARFFAWAFIQHTFNQNSISPMVSFIEQILYLNSTNPAAVGRIMTELKGRAKYEENR